MSKQYLLQEILREGNVTSVYRARREPDGVPVVLKSLKSKYPSAEDTARFTHEYEVTAALNLEGVIRVIGFERHPHKLAMVLEDFGGISLDRLNGKPFDLGLFFSVALAVCAALDQLHQNHVIHKDINPTNILLNPKTNQVKLIDFGCAVTLAREDPTFGSPSLLEGTLAYMSPEQTGRMNRAVDYRSDYYSLGATFYELLTGRPPFQAQDALELVHAHLAYQPIPAHVLNPALPEPISAIVTKLLSKEAEDRYQSAAGLIYDLETCRQQWQISTEIQPLTPGQHDISGRFQIPQKLYGRGAESQQLMEIFQQVSDSGRSEIVLVSGAPGVGKTALIQELHRPITRQRGTFIRGKYDQLQHDRPYAALIQAYRELIRHILAEGEGQIAAWRENILAALGPNTRIIIDLIPELERITGPQPELPELAPSEALNRGRLTFLRFASLLSQSGTSLVIFLDDLQWADPASIKLIEMILNSPDCPRNLMIGAYRDTEVNPTHPLSLMFKSLQNSGVEVKHIALSSLSIEDVTHFTADLLKRPPEEVRPLAELAFEKTDGNPFFLQEFFHSLCALESIHFDRQLNRWSWDLDEIQKQAITENVVELLARRAQQLPQATQRVLKMAACLGNSFDLDTLAIVCETPAHQTAAALLEAMQIGLVLPLNETYKLVTEENRGVGLSQKAAYRFAHDRIQQAMDILVQEVDSRQVHYQVGHLLLQKLPEERRQEQIFDIVFHLNHAYELTSSTGERDALAELNLNAGRKAKNAIAYDSALIYLQAGLKLLGPEGWQRCYPLALALHIEAVETAFLNGKYELMEQFAAEALSQTRSLMDQVKIYEIQLQALTIQTQAREALDLAFGILTRLGVHLPAQPTPANIGEELAETQALLAGKNVESMLDLPLMTDPEKLAAMRILSFMMSPSHIAMPQIFPILVMRQVRLSIQYGNCPGSCVGYALFGWILCGSTEDIETGYRFGQLALALLDRLNARELRAMVVQLVAIGAQHWKEPFRAILPCLPEAYQTGLETGDLAYAGYSAHQVCIHTYFSGIELPELKSLCGIYNSALANIHQQTALQWNRAYLQAALNLSGKSADPCRLEGPDYHEDEMLAVFEAANDGSGLSSLYIHKLILNYLFGEYGAAVEYAEKAEVYLDSLNGLLLVPVFYFYDSLARLAAQGADALEKVDANQAKLKRWAQFAPGNYLNKATLVDAERARVMGQNGSAREAYDQAIDLAGKYELVQELALANELAGKFYLAQQRKAVAGVYLNEARYTYQHWGAQAKVCDLEKRYFEVLILENEPAVPGMKHRLGTNPADIGGLLDIASVIKASQALSCEIVFGQLAAKLTVVLAENAAAQRAFFILEKDGRLFIEAQMEAGQPAVHLAEPLPLETAAERLALSIVNYAAHSRESVVLDQAGENHDFSNDQYIQQQKPKSILCLPILSGGRLAGVLYLENNLVTHGFPPERVKLLSILAAQAAIALENAQLYASLEKEVKKRTAELEETNRQLRAEIAERIQTENALLESEMRFSKFMENLPSPAFIKDEHGKTLYINTSFERMFGSDLMEKTLAEVFPAEIAEQMAADDRRVLDEDLLQREELITDLSGIEHQLQTTKFVIRQKDGPVLIGGIGIDITERKQMEAELQKLAAFDALTGCLNRRHFFDLAAKEFERTLRYQKNLSLIMLDIDHFKQVNDTHGHAVGDQILKMMGTQIRAEVRGEDLVGRYGGEEFVLLLVETNLDTALIAAERLRSSVEKLSVNGGSGPVSITISVGVSSLREETDMELLLKAADDALYAAKVSGRNRVCAAESG
jgi:diguanylate cyclase (GGDEF)-like protein/PAS domain S-box-containing protein